VERFKQIGGLLHERGQPVGNPEGGLSAAGVFLNLSQQMSDRQMRVGQRGGSWIKTRNS
jgi:hypothetical protein